MRRTSPRLRLAQLLSRPLLRQTSDPDTAFEQVHQRLRHDDDAVIDQAVLDGYRTRLHAYAQTPGLSGIGWRIALGEVAHRLGNRLRVQRLHAQHPELSSLPITAPIIVVGLPRTGTTLAHNVLAAARGARGPRLWEMFDIDRPGQRSEKDLHRLKRRVNRQMDEFLRLSPDWDLIHPMRAESIEENTFLLDHSVMDLGTAPMPGYWEYLTGDYDAVADFAFLKQALQVLSAGRAPTRWVLKHPGNLYFIPAIMRVFPDAKIVWTHRAPATVFGSMCSMAESLHHLHMHSRAVDPLDIGQRWLTILAHGVQTARDQKAALIAQSGYSRASFIDLSYAALMADPYAQVAKLMEQLELPWGEHEQQSLRRALARPRDGRRHDYGERRYGFDSGEVEEAFGGDYTSMLTLLDATSKA